MVHINIVRIEAGKNRSEIIVGEFSIINNAIHDACLFLFSYIQTNEKISLNILYLEMKSLIFVLCITYFVLDFFK